MIKLTLRNQPSVSFLVNPDQIENVEGNQNGSIVNFRNHFREVRETPEQINTMAKEDFKAKTKHLMPYWPA